MNSKTLKLTTVISICLSLLIFFNCSSKGESMVYLSGIPSQGERPPDWPCDTCLVILKMVDSKTGEVKTSKKTTLMRSIVWPPDTTSLKLINLAKGKYRLEVNIRDLKTDSTVAIWYYSRKASKGLVGDLKDAQIINITGDTLKVHFREMAGRPGMP